MGQGIKERRPVNIVSPLDLPGRQLRPAAAGVDLTVCVLSWNGAKMLKACLQSLRDVKPLNAIVYETIVVDNGSQDETVEMVRSEFPEVAVIANPANVGFSAGNNQAIREGMGRYFLILNNDTVVLGDSLAQMVRLLDHEPEVGMVGGKLLNRDGTTQVLYYRRRLPSLATFLGDLVWLDRVWPNNPWGRAAEMRAWDPDKPCELSQLPGAFMMVRRELLEQVGLFDENYPCSYEDVDLCARCLAAGWKIRYLADARVLHFGAGTFKSLGWADKSTLRFRGLLLYVQKHFDRWSAMLFKVLFTLILTFRLPLILVARYWPRAEVRHRWEGAGRAYIRALKETWQRG